MAVVVVVAVSGSGSGSGDGASGDEKGDSARGGGRGGSGRDSGVCVDLGGMAVAGVVGRFDLGGVVHVAVEDDVVRRVTQLRHELAWLGVGVRVRVRVGVRLGLGSAGPIMVSTP